MSYTQTFLFGIYPYIALTIFLLGSLIRFDREQYTWKSDSSQLLKRGQLRLGSNLFHIGVLFLFFGHFFGMLTPHYVYEPFMSSGAKQILAMVSGGIAGVLALIGISILLHRRLTEPRIRATTKPSDILILLLLWLQLLLGMITLPFSFAHRQDAHAMLILASYLQGIATLAPDASVLAGIDWPFKLHMLLGMTIFLLFPFSRLVHVWSGFATVAYLFRPRQLVRSRRLNVPAGHNQPGRTA